MFDFPKVEHWNRDCDDGTTVTILKAKILYVWLVALVSPNRPVYDIGKQQTNTDERLLPSLLKIYFTPLLGNTLRRRRHNETFRVLSSLAYC